MEHIADPRRLSEDFVYQTGSLPPLKKPLNACQQHNLDNNIISFSTASQSSTNSNEASLETRNSKFQLARIYKPAYRPQANGDDRPYSVRSSVDSYGTQESMLMSQRQLPPLQVMDRSSGSYENERSSSSMFTADSMPPEWSLPSNESLFSLPEDHIRFSNGKLMKEASFHESLDVSLSKEELPNQPSIAFQHETLTRAPDKSVDETGPPVDDTDACMHELHWDSLKSKGSIQPLRSSKIMEPDEKPSSCCEKPSCDQCSCTSLFSCWLTSDFSYICKMPSLSSCCNSKVGWCCIWDGCSRNTCCSYFPKGSCCQSWSCCSCLKSSSCFSMGSCCESWRFSTISCW